MALDKLFGNPFNALSIEFIIDGMVDVDTEDAVVNNELSAF